MLSARGKILSDRSLRTHTYPSGQHTWPSKGRTANVRGFALRTPLCSPTQPFPCITTAPSTMCNEQVRSCSNKTLFTTSDGGRRAVQSADLSPCSTRQWEKSAPARAGSPCWSVLSAAEGRVPKRRAVSAAGAPLPCAPPPSRPRRPGRLRHSATRPSPPRDLCPTGPAPQRALPPYVRPYIFPPFEHCVTVTTHQLRPP